jgi:hypothetical protein
MNSMTYVILKATETRWLFCFVRIFLPFMQGRLALPPTYQLRYTVCMHSIQVRELMKDGKELRNAGPGVYGEVTMHWWNEQPRLVVSPGNGQQGKLLPTLWFAECVGFFRNRQNWKGWQQGKSGPVQQMWEITFHDGPPPAGEAGQ